MGENETTGTGVVVERRKVGVVMPAELHRRLKVVAAERDRTVSDLVVEAVTRYLEELERTP